MKKFISFSGGVESSTMCLLFGQNADAIFADTGDEHQEVYDRIDLVQEKVRQIHGNNFTIHKVKNEKHKSLPKYAIESKFLPSFRTRYCTRMFKIEPIDNYLKQFKDEGVELMIGLNSEEIDQRTGNHGLLPFVKYSYPLADNGFNRAMCEVLLRKADLHPNFPVYMKRGGCRSCFFKSKKEYQAMALLSPTEFNTIIELEEGIQDQRAEFFSIIDGLTMRQLRDNVLAQGLLFELDEIYAIVNNATNFGVFCNR